jgi:hypothetical protein
MTLVDVRKLPTSQLILLAMNPDYLLECIGVDSTDDQIKHAVDLVVTELDRRIPIPEK